MARPTSKPALVKVERKSHPYAPDVSTDDATDEAIPPSSPPARRTKSVTVPDVEPTVKMTVVIPEELHRQTKVAATLNGHSIQVAVIEALQAWLAQNK